MVQSTKFSGYWDNDNPPIVSATPVATATLVEQQPHHDESDFSSTHHSIRSNNNDPSNDPLNDTIAAGIIETTTTTPQEEADSLNANGDDDFATSRCDATNLKVGAGVACGVLGLMFGGPFLAAIAGFGAAYCTQKEGLAGDAARAVGEVAISAKEKAQEVNEKHKLVDEGKKAANQAWETAKEMDRKHGIVDKIKDFAVESLKFAIGGIRLLSKKIAESMEESCSSDSNNNNANNNNNYKSYARQ